LAQKKVSRERKRRCHNAAAVLDAFATATNPFFLVIFILLYFKVTQLQQHHLLL